MANIYPQITDITLVPLRALELVLESNPGMLDDPKCPYSPSVKAFLKKLQTKTTPIIRREYNEEDLENEIQDLYEDLKQTDVGTDAKDRIAFLKTRADLLTRMVALKERSLNVRDMARFQKMIIETIETHLTPAQRNQFLETLTNNVR